MRHKPLLPETIDSWGWLARAPFFAFGLLLGASLWYVARRLYWNLRGYISFLIYCFSPGILRSCALWFAEPESGAAWGAFGAIFTAIAVAHTLYAPREVVLWNWRRILLLGISLALAIGSQFSLIVLLPMALGFMFYLAPARKGAAIVIWAAACGLAGVLLFASYFFHPFAFVEGMRQANWFGFSAHAFVMRGAYLQVFSHLRQGSPALMVAVPAALITYWRACGREPATLEITPPAAGGGRFSLAGDCHAPPSRPGIRISRAAVSIRVRRWRFRRYARD